jgi:hypothetical protein
MTGVKAGHRRRRPATTGGIKNRRSGHEVHTRIDGKRSLSPPVIAPQAIGAIWRLPLGPRSESAGRYDRTPPPLLSRMDTSTSLGRDLDSCKQAKSRTERRVWSPRSLCPAARRLADRGDAFALRVRVGEEVCVAVLQRLLLAPDVFARDAPVRSEVVADGPIVVEERAIRREDVDVDGWPVSAAARQVGAARHGAFTVMAVAKCFQCSDGARAVRLRDGHLDVDDRLAADWDRGAADVFDGRRDRDQGSAIRAASAAYCWGQAGSGSDSDTSSLNGSDMTDQGCPTLPLRGVRSGAGWSGQRAC